MGDVEPSSIEVKYLGRQPYLLVWQAMKDFTQHRNDGEVDQLWIVEHDPVFTLGRNGSPAHILDAGSIPIVNTDRGGQVTYHGPGQVVIYCLLDLKRYELGIRALVELIENSVIELLKQFQIAARGDRKAPGVYVGDAKIAALGLRVSKGCTYHGVSLNVDMDLAPFSAINPCGYAGLKVTQCKDLGIELTVEQAGKRLSDIVVNRLNQHGS